MDPVRMRDVARDVSETLKILASPTRLLAMCELVDGERSVGELARLIGLRDQAMSQQLSVLRAHGMVQTRRDGQTIYYSLARQDVRGIIERLYELYCVDGPA